MGSQYAHLQLPKWRQGRTVPQMGAEGLGLPVEMGSKLVQEVDLLISRKNPELLGEAADVGWDELG